jgi:hypothetical protein
MHGLSTTDSSPVFDPMIERMVHFCFLFLLIRQEKKEIWFLQRLRSTLLTVKARIQPQFSAHQGHPRPGRAVGGRLHSLLI